MVGSAVYLIDNDPQATGPATQALQSAGHAVQMFDSTIAFLESGVGNGCAVVAAKMPYLGGMDVLRALKAASNPLPIILLNDKPDVDLAVEAIKNGAEDFLVKPIDGDRLVAAVDGALKRIGAESAQRQWINDLRARHNELTSRQRIVCAMVLRGMVHRDIAQRMGLSVGTVKASRSRAMAKLGVSSAVELAFALGALGVRPDEPLEDQLAILRSSGDIEAGE